MLRHRMKIQIFLSFLSYIQLDTLSLTSLFSLGTLPVLPESCDEISPIFCKISPKIFQKQRTAPKTIQTCI